MRQYVYMFWALVLGGMVLLTAAYPPCTQYSENRYYRIHDRDGKITLVTGREYSAAMSQHF